MRPMILNRRQALSHEEALKLTTDLSKKYYTELYHHTDHKTWVVVILGKKQKIEAVTADVILD